MPQTRGAWIGVAAFVCIVLTVATWFFFVSPKLDERADLAGQEDRLVLENNQLETKVAALRAQFAKIDEYRAELGQLRVRIPTVAQADDLLDSIDSLASKHDVSVYEVIAEGGTSLVGDTVAVPTPTPTPADEGDAKKTDAAKKPEPKAAPGWKSGSPVDLVALPYKIGIEADYADAITFVKALQTSKERFFLVSDPVITALDQEQDGVSAEVSVSFTLYAFVLTEEATANAETGEKSDPKKIPTSDENHFVTTS